jgi:rubrerythrin
MSEVDLETILCDALEDERKAEATYGAVIDKFGPVRPFTNIIDAERRHSLAIERQMQRLGLTIPPNNWEGKASAPASLASACDMAIQAEIENIALYDRLIPGIDEPMVRQVLQNLQDASRDNHLPAFRRCAAREKGERNAAGSGPGGRGGRRHRGGRCS